MSRRWFLFVLGLAIPVLFLVQVSSAHIGLAVNEAATTCSLRGVAPQVSLVIDNGLRKGLSALVRLELLDPDNKIRATSERKASLTTGRQSLIFILPMKSRDLAPNSEDKSLWYRLHYRITPDLSSDEIAPIEGFISLSEITSDLFELRVVGSGAVREGTLYHVKVDATHPVTHRPSAGVLIKGTMTLDNDKLDNETLETAMRGSDWSRSQYDVLPDRVVVYLWPRAGGSSFSFKFKPRLAMTAKSSASTVYDYYNPTARAIVAPSRFVVR